MNTEHNSIVKVIDWKDDIPVIFFKEEDQPTLKTNIMLWNQIKQISNGKGCYFIIDVSNAKPPNVEVRAYTKKQYESSKNYLLHSYILPGSNLFIKGLLKFILASMGLKCFTVVDTAEDALNHIKNEI